MTALCNTSVIMAVLILCLTSTIFCERQKDHSNNINFILDFIRHMSAASPIKGVHAFVCWDTGDLQLMKALSRNGVPASVYRGWQHWKQLPTFHMDGNSLLFILDLKCGKSVALLKKAGEIGEFFRPPHTWLILHDVYPAGTLHHIAPTSDTMLPVPAPTNNGRNLIIQHHSALSTYNNTLTPNAIELGDEEYNTADVYDISPRRRAGYTNGNSIHITQTLPRSSKNNAEFKSEHTNDDAPMGEIVDVCFYCEVFRDLNILVDSNVVVGRREADTKYTLLEAYRRRKLGELVVSELGYWERSTGIVWQAVHEVALRRLDLKRTKLVASIVVTNPETLDHLDDLHNRHIDTVTKLNYLLLLHAADILNASLELVVTDEWGYESNGSWSGLVGSLQRGEADVGGTALFVTADRMRLIDYIALTTPSVVAFVFRQPPLSLVSNLFTLPFSRAVWACAAALVVTCAGLLMAATRWEWRRGDPQLASYLQQFQAAAAQLRDKWGDVAMLAVGAVCQQGSPAESRGVPGRIVTLSLLVMVMFLYTSYSASIVVLLQSTTTSIQTLADLLYSPLGLGVHDIVYNRHFFPAADDPVRRALYRQKVAPPGGEPRFMTLEEGVRRMRTEPFAFHSELSPTWQLVQETFREEDKCGLQAIPFLQLMHPYIAVQKNTCYKEMFKIAYRRIWERGLQHRQLSRLYTMRKPRCAAGRGTSFVTVGIADCYPALLVPVYGVAIAVLVVLLEILFHRRKGKKSPTLTTMNIRSNEGHKSSSFSVRTLQ
uniref:Ionotropic receptor 3 n=1 Tax=Ceracris kiangsu TaxID=227354 RepID=A0A6M6DPD1_CERKI|nr:ionotropic receptor 3 [Ceracris kiangsu]